MSNQLITKTRKAEFPPLPAALSETTEQRAARLSLIPPFALNEEQRNEIALVAVLLESRAYYWRQRANALQTEADDVARKATKLERLTEALHNSLHAAENSRINQ